MPRIVWQSLQLCLCQTRFPRTTSSVSLSVFVRLGMVVWVSMVSQMKDGRADDRSPDKEIPGSLLLHRNLLDEEDRTRILNLECLERG